MDRSYSESQFSLFSLLTEPVEIIGGGKNIYTYQIGGTGTATIQGSNDNINWVSLTTAALTAPNSLVVIHSWRFIRKTGTATVIVSRG